MSSSKELSFRAGSIETDIGDDRHFRRDDVRAVEPSAKAYLYHSNVHFLLFKIKEGERCGEFKERRMERFKETALLLHKVDDTLFGDHLSIDADTLTEVNEMGRSVETYLITGLLKHGSDTV